MKSKEVQEREEIRKFKNKGAREEKRKDEGSEWERREEREKAEDR